MADDPIDTLRLSLMQELLPVGLAMVERAKNGGASKVVEVFASSDDPLNDLREEGESAARSVRERLDNLRPGLGNPVMSVEVAVADESSNNQEIDNDQVLFETLKRIEENLADLENHLDVDRRKPSTSDSVIGDIDGD